MENSGRHYALYVAADQMDQARAFLRQALSVLRPANAAYSSVQQAIALVEAERRTAFANIEAHERMQIDYVMNVEAGGQQR